jgi:hypothetical protein
MTNHGFRVVAVEPIWCENGLLGVLPTDIVDAKYPLMK